ncbi:MAG: DEAD/DEAH box helicase, partial [Myxococcota bacterium]
MSDWRARFATQLTLDETIPAREAKLADVPNSLAPNVVAALRKRGIDKLYAHQAHAIELGLQGRDFVVATPTASGKSLCYTLPILHRLAVDESARALFLFPTKALSRDQEVNLRGLLRDANLPHGAITFDG